VAMRGLYDPRRSDHGAWFDHRQGCAAETAVNRDLWAKLLGAQTMCSLRCRRSGSSTSRSRAGAFRLKAIVWCLRAEDQCLLWDHNLDVLE